MSGRDTASLDTGAGAKAANNSVDDLSEAIRSLDKKAQGEYSLRLLLAARTPEQLRDTIPAVHRVFVDARAQVMEETLGSLSALCVRSAPLTPSPCMGTRSLRSNRNTAAGNIIGASKVARDI
jgi:hypothetical protein